MLFTEVIFMFTKNILATILCLGLTAGLVPTGVFLAAAEEYSPDTSWYNGGASEEYSIASAGQLSGCLEEICR